MSTNIVKPKEKEKEKEKKKKGRPRLNKDPKHYVNNKDFSEAIIEYVNYKNQEIGKGNPSPIVTDYIAISFLKICDGLSHRPNFNGYTYRKDMVMDGVENCLKALPNFNVEAATRSGTPNAFGYFTQISYFAFLRRIKKENKEIQIIENYIEDKGMELFASYDGEDKPKSAERLSGGKLKKKIKEISDSKESNRKTKFHKNPPPASRGFGIPKIKSKVISDKNLDKFLDQGKKILKSTQES